VDSEEWVEKWKTLLDNGDDDDPKNCYL